MNHTGMSAAMSTDKKEKDQRTWSDQDSNPDFLFPGRFSDRSRCSHQVELPLLISMSISRSSDQNGSSVALCWADKHYKECLQASPG